MRSCIHSISWVIVVLRRRIPRPHTDQRALAVLFGLTLASGVWAASSTPNRQATHGFEIAAGATGIRIPVGLPGHSAPDPGKTRVANANGAVAGSIAPVFSIQEAFDTGFGPDSVAVADVNGDGKPDLIVANYFDNTVSVFLNTTPPGAAMPSFATPRTFATGGGPTSVAVADISGDGKPDLIVTNSTDNTVSVLMNTTPPGATTPSFAPQKTFTTGMFPSSVAVADINGDGKPDLVVTNANDNTVSVLINTTPQGVTAPSFAPQKTFATGVDPLSVAVADVNGDGKPDLIVANNISNTVSVLLNTTPASAVTPSFAPQKTFATGAAPQSVTVADVNGNGKPDLIVANFAANTVSVLLNTTPAGTVTPSFAPQKTFATGAGPQSVTVADVNGNGKPDLIVANSIDDTLSMLLNDTTRGATVPDFLAQRIIGTNGDPESVVATNLDGPGRPDLIVANFSSNTLSVLLNATPDSGYRNPAARSNRRGGK